MTHSSGYPIGTTGTPWGDAERGEWFAIQTVKRAYSDDVLQNIEALTSRFTWSQYGALTINPERYPLFAARSLEWDSARATVLVTGGVHGYETSGVHGALRFLETRAADAAYDFNVVVAPCVSPWGYETINRWNPQAIDPNRSFQEDGFSEESAALIAYLRTLNTTPQVHIDLHETTDTDNSEFRPALAARDAKEQSVWDIPDGFYTVGDTDRPEPGFQAAIINSVSRVTHIAPPDQNGTIIGETPQQEGVINYAAKPLGLCMGMTDAAYVSTTEVYPDSPRVNAETCVQAQLAAIEGALGFARRR